MILGQVLFEIIFNKKFTTFCFVVIFLGVSEMFFDEEDLFFIMNNHDDIKFQNKIISENERSENGDEIDRNDLSYHKARIQFPSEYDRLNPVT